MPTETERVHLRSPNIPNRDKSDHMRGGGNAPYVRVRHPEVRRMAASEDPCGCGDIASDSTETNNVDHKCEQFADTSCYPIDNFNRIVAQPALTEGDPWSGSIYGGRQTESSGYSFGPLGWWQKKFGSYVGDANISWTKPGNTCGGFGFMFSGWAEEEVWYAYTVPAAPADAAGINVDLDVTVLSRGDAAQVGARVLISPTQPTGLRQGVDVGPAYPGASTTFIPIGLLPPEGGTLYIGVVPGWSCERGSVYCGFDFPRRNGANNSGRCTSEGVFAAPVNWVVWVGLTRDFGGSLSGDESGAWWDSVTPWQVSGSGTSLLSMTGHSLKFDVPAGSQSSVSLRLDGFYAPDDSDTDEQYDNPWDHENGIRLKMRFKAVTAGSLTEDGARYLSLMFADGYDRYSVTAYLGDTGHAEGVEVLTEDSSDYLAKAITNGSWMWLTLDTRHPTYARGKMWVETEGAGTGEPPKFDVQVTREQETEVPLKQNFLQIDMSAGNATGDNQVIYIDQLLACGPANRDCQWVEEKIGEGNGLVDEFVTSMPFKTGSLWFFVDGFHVRTKTIDKDEGEFRAVQKRAAANRATLVARYLYESRPGE